MKQLSLILIFLSGYSLTSWGQIDSNICWTPEEDGVYISQFLDMTESENVFWKTIKTVVHIHHTDSFSYSQIPQEHAENAIANLNEQFAEYLFDFDLLAVEYHDLDESEAGAPLATGEACAPASYRTLDLGEEVSWNRDEIMNVHVLPDMCGGILGFAWRRPISFNGADGVWVQTNVFGVDGDYLIYNRAENKTLVHEVGHYLGLYHVFQGVDFCGEDPEADCTQIHDNICDTPPTKVNYSCVSPWCPTTYNPDRPWADYVHNNHMDYYIDSCRTAFTYGQFLYMHNWVVVERPTLIDEVPFCWGDFNGDLVVGTNDLLMLLAEFGEPAEDGCPQCDLNKDGIIGATDLLLLNTVYGNECAGAAGMIVPEEKPIRVMGERRGNPRTINIRP